MYDHYMYRSFRVMLLTNSVALKNNFKFIYFLGQFSFVGVIFTQNQVNIWFCVFMYFVGENWVVLALRIISKTKTPFFLRWHAHDADAYADNRDTPFILL